MTVMKKLCAAAVVAAVSFALAGCEKLRARDHLNKGVAEFKSAKYGQAVEHFKEAVKLDPTFPTARLYLATAYMSQYIPGAESPENMQNAQAAQDHFLKVLQQDAHNNVALRSLAYLHYSQAQGSAKLEDKLKKLDESREWYQKLVNADARDKEGHYSLGVIAWAKWYPALMTARAKLGMKPEDPGPLKDKKLREELKAQWTPTIEDGINHLQKALEIDPEYDDAMAYMNLLIRERADLADTPEQYKKDIDTAENWVQKTMETKRIKAERLNQRAAGGVTAQ